MVFRNPLLVMYWRTALSRKGGIAALIATFLLGALVLLLALSAHDRHAARVAFYVLYTIQAGALFLGGVSRAAAAIGAERLTGLIDFHRASPLAPWRYVWGSLWGVAVVPWLVALVLLPFAVVLALVAGLGPLSVLVLYVVTTTCAVLYLLVGMTAGFLAPSGWTGVTGAVVLVMGLLMSVPMVLATVGPVLTVLATPFVVLVPLDQTGSAFSGSRAMASFYGLEVPTLLLALLVQAVLIAVLFAGAVRRYRRPDFPWLSRPQAVGCYAAILALGLGMLWRFIAPPPPSGPFSDWSFFNDDIGQRLVATAFLLGSAGFAAGLLALLTPSAHVFLLGLRRALKRKALGSGPLPWPDTRSNLGLALALGAVGAAFALALALGAKPAVGTVPPVAAILTALLLFATLAALSRLFEWAALAFPAHALAFALLFLFVHFAVPVMVGGLIGLERGGLGNYVAAMSPPVGLIGAAMWLLGTADAGPVSFLSLCIASLVFQVVIAAGVHVLCLRVRRRLGEVVAPAAAKSA